MRFKVSTYSLDWVNDAPEGWAGEVVTADEFDAAQERIRALEAENTEMRGRIAANRFLSSEMAELEEQLATCQQERERLRNTVEFWESTTEVGTFIQNQHQRIAALEQRFERQKKAVEPFLQVAVSVPADWPDRFFYPNHIARQTVGEYRELAAAFAEEEKKQ